MSSPFAGFPESLASAMRSRRSTFSVRFSKWTGVSLRKNRQYSSFVWQ